jgi:hypothetical protein
MHINFLFLSFILILPSKLILCITLQDEFSLPDYPTRMLQAFYNLLYAHVPIHLNVLLVFTVEKFSCSTCKYTTISSTLSLSDHYS